MALFGLYHFMIYRVNKLLPKAERIPHARVLDGGMRFSYGFDFSLVRRQHKRLYPGSVINSSLVGCIGLIVALAVILATFRIWEYTHGKLP